MWALKIEQKGAGEEPAGRKGDVTKALYLLGIILKMLYTTTVGRQKVTTKTTQISEPLTEPLVRDFLVGPGHDETLCKTLYKTFSVKHSIKLSKKTSMKPFMKPSKGPLL